MEAEGVVAALRRHVVREILDGDGRGLDADTRLLETGVLDSMTMVDLIAFIETTWDVRVPDEDVTPERFETLRAVEALVLRLLDRAA